MLSSHAWQCKQVLQVQKMKRREQRREDFFFLYVRAMFTPTTLHPGGSGRSLNVDLSLSVSSLHSRHSRSPARTIRNTQSSLLHRTGLRSSPTSNASVQCLSCLVSAAHDTPPTSPLSPPPPLSLNAHARAHTAHKATHSTHTRHSSFSRGAFVAMVHPLPPPLRVSCASASPPIPPPPLLRQIHLMLTRHENRWNG